MALWLGILVAAVFAWYAVKLGFYQTWALLFNLLIAAYAAIHLCPAVRELAPIGADSSYGPALCMLVIAAALFLVLHTITTVFLLGTFTVTFPKIMETLGAALIGFMAGFLVWSFASLLICSSPVSDHKFVREIGFDRKTFHEAKMHSYMTSCCKILDAMVLSQGEEGTKPAIDLLLSSAPRRKTPANAPDANEPNLPREMAAPAMPDEPAREEPATPPP